MSNVTMCSMDAKESKGVKYGTNAIGIRIAIKGQNYFYIVAFFYKTLFRCARVANAMSR